MPAAGQIIRALDFPPLFQADQPDDQTNLSNTGFQPGSPECSGTFVVGTSGTVEVTVVGLLRGDNTNRAVLSWELYEGTGPGGTLKFGATVARAAYNVDSTEITSSDTFVATGLTAGATHFIRTMQAVGGGTTGDILNRRLVVRRG